MKAFAALFLFLSLHSASAKEIVTNEVSIPNAPAWLTQLRVESVTNHISSYLEWDIRKVNVTWYTDQAAFEAVHGFGPSVLAFARRSDNSVHVGPRVTKENFDQVFGHELVHVIVNQKYKDAIPHWLDEGLANYVSKHGRIDYVWLALQPARDIHTLEHPFKALTSDGAAPRYHYMASTAVMEMIASKCSVNDLLQLAVGKKLETYLSTYCEIDDLNDALKDFIARKAKAAARKTPPPK